MSAAPSWYTELSDAAPLERATDPIGFHPTINGFLHGQGLGRQPSDRVLLRESLGMADTATRAIANRISTLNPQVKVSRRVEDGTLRDEVIDDSPLKALLDRPHPDLSRAQLLRLTAQYIVTVGAAYWLKVGSRLGVPVELHPIPPQMVTPIHRDGVVVGYNVETGDGGQQTLRPEDVVRFYLPDPESPWTAEGYLGPQATTADSAKFAGQTLRRHYQHDATPKTVLEAGEGATAFQPEEEKRFHLAWRKKFGQRLGTDPDVPAILPTHYKLIQLAMKHGADVVPLLEFWRDEQLMGFGTPKSVLGMVVSGDRSAAETNAFVFDLHTVLPVANLLQDGMTLQLAPDFDPRLFVQFEPFVSEDKEFGLKRERQDLETKVASPNMVLEARGHDPVPWGERPVATLGEGAYEPDLEAPPLPSDDASAMEDAEDDERAGRGARARAFFSPDASWKRQVVTERSFVPPFLRAVRRVLKEQRRDVLDRLPDALDRARIDPDDVFDPDAWGSAFDARIEPVRVAAFEAVITETISAFGFQSFSFTEAMRELLRIQAAALVKHANRTTRARIARELLKATQLGEGISQVAARIRRVFDVRSKEARTIARTEILKASQTAQLEGFAIAGIAEKRWNTSRDETVRDTHAPVDGQEVALLSSFRLGDGERADAPGVGEGGRPLSAANSINCRCFVTPVLED